MLVCIEKWVQLYLAVSKCDITNDTMRGIKYAEDTIELERYWLSIFIFEFSFVRFKILKSFVVENFLICFFKFKWNLRVASMFSNLDIFSPSN